MLENIQLQLLLATFAGWVTRQQSHVIAYMIEENRVLKEQLESSGKRVRFTDDCIGPPILGSLLEAPNSPSVKML